MEKFTISNVAFVTGMVVGNAPPQKLNMEIAMVGRSNVGKSSLINSLCNNNKLARISSTPGKTRQINFFSVNREYYLVDLPGYGFARSSKEEQKRWGELMESYLSTGRITHIFLLLDIRHEPTQEDKQMYQWILYYGVPFTIVATKADKIARTKQQSAANMVAKSLGAPPYAIPYSTQPIAGREILLERIGAIYNDAKQRLQAIAVDTDE